MIECGGMIRIVKINLTHEINSQIKISKFLFHLKLLWKNTGNPVFLIQ